MPTTVCSVATRSADRARSATRTASAPTPPPTADRTSPRNTDQTPVGWNERPERAAHSLVADLFPQQRVIDELDLPAAELHRSTTFEIYEHAVHRDACRADERGKVLLRERHDVRPEQLALIDQQLRDAPGEIEEHEILYVPRAPPDPCRQQREQLPHRIGAAAQYVHEVVIGERERHRFRHRSDRRRPRTLIEQGDLAEHVAAAVQRDDDLLPALFRY